MENLMKIIIFLLLVLVFGSVVIWIAAAVLGMYAVMIGIGLAVFALGAAITYIIKNKWHVKIEGFAKKALTKLGESSAGNKIAPYAKWVMYACELFFILNIFINFNINRNIPALCLWIFAVCLIVLYTFKDDKNIFYGASIYIGIELLEVIFNSIRLGGAAFRYIPAMIPVVLKLIAFGTIAYLAKRRLCNTISADNSEIIEKKPVNKLLAASPFVLVLLFFVVSIVSYAVSPQTRFNIAINSGNVIQAVELYTKIPNDTNKKANVAKLKSAITDLTDGYISGSVDYEVVSLSLEVMYGINDLQKNSTEAMKRINEIKESKEAFDSAAAHENSGDLITALSEYEKVISNDKSNYAAAADKIKQIRPQIKTLAFSEIKENIENDDYVNAKKVLDNALITLPHDSELLNLKKDIDSKTKAILLSNAKEMIENSDFYGAKSIVEEGLSLFKSDKNFLNLKTTVDDALRAEQAEKAKSEQLVTVENAEVIEQREGLKALYPDTASILVKNVSDKVVKNYTAAYRGNDKANYLIEIKTKDSNNSELEKTMRIEGANIQPGDVYQDKSVEFASDMNISAAGVSACIIRVDFEDGTTWENPYYEFWNTDLSSYAGVRTTKSTSRPKSSSGSSGSKSNSSKEDSDFEKYLKENDPASYKFYQDLEKRWDSLR